MKLTKILDFWCMDAVEEGPGFSLNLLDGK